jgi:hypothetical protein
MSRRFPSRAFVVAAVLVLVVAIGAILLRPAPGPAGLPPVDAPADWQVSNLVDHLHERGVRLRPVATMRDGDIDGTRGAYLTETALGWEQLIRLPEAPEHIDQWAGTVRIQRGEVGAEQRNRLRGCCMVAGPFFLCGDPDLLRRIAEALAGAEDG